jgi:hypothetical protein
VELLEDDGLVELLDDDGLVELLLEELGLEDDELLSMLELELELGELLEVEGELLVLLLVSLPDERLLELELEGEDERLDPEELPCGEVLEPSELPCDDVSEPRELLLPCVELELLSPMVDDDELPPPCTPSAESVCWSSFPEELICCDCWNCFRAERVCGPSWPSICPVSKPLSFRACCTSRMVDASFCDDALCWREAEDCDCCELPDFELLLSFGNAAVEESARAAMTKWRSFMVCDFLSGGGAGRRQEVQQGCA